MIVQSEEYLLFVLFFTLLGISFQKKNEMKGNEKTTIICTHVQCT